MNQRYVIEYLDAGGVAHAAYFKNKKDAEQFWGTLHGRGLAFYLEELVEEKPEFSVFRRVKSFYPTDDSNIIKPSP